MKKRSVLQKNFEMIVESKMPTETLSKIFSTSSSDLSLMSEPGFDRFQDLRYDEALASRKCPRLQVWDPVVSVLVKRPLAYQPPEKVAKPFTLGLQLGVDEMRQPLKLYEPVSRLTRNVVEALNQDKVPQPWCQNDMLQRGLEKQEHALQTWEDKLKPSARNAARISKEIGRPAAELLLSTPLRLPPPENHRSKSYGPEQDFPKFKHQERFYHSDAFFWMPQRVGPAESSIDTSPTWTERKYYKPPLTIARPHLEDTLPTSLRDGKKYQDQERARSLLHKIVVKGTASRLHYPSSVARCSPDYDRGKKEDSEKASPPHKAPPDCVHSKVCLMVEGNMYSWGEPGPQVPIEVSFSCLAGERAYNHIRLANMGKTVIRCFWFKTFHSDHFNKGHYRAEHFIFDCSDRIILPWDQVTLKVQFHADYPGFWREVWYLKTEPALGPGGGSAIPISLWARALAADYGSRRRDLERQLDVLVAERIAADYRDQLLRNLPYRDYETILRERFPMTENIFVVDDVEVFEQANPGLCYNGHAMFNILNLYRKVQKFRSLSIEVKDARILEKTEESCKTGETQKYVSSKRTRSFADRTGFAEERKNDVILVQMSSKTDAVPRRTEVDTLLEGDPADKDPLERRNISVEGIYNMVRELDERLEEKNNMFMELNQAVSDMSFRRGRSNVSNFKHLVCRTALCQAADDVVDIAQRLQHDLRMKLRRETGRWTPISTDSKSSAVQSTSKGKKMHVPNPKQDTRRNTMLYSPSWSIDKFRVLSKIFLYKRHVDRHLKSRSEATGGSICMTRSAEITGSPEMYRKLLSVLVYERVERLLLDLLPLITDDEQQLNPLKPRPEL